MEPDQLAEPAVGTAQDLVSIQREPPDAPGELIGIEAAGTDPALVDLKDSARHGQIPPRLMNAQHSSYISKWRAGAKLIQDSQKSPQEIRAGYIELSGLAAPPRLDGSSRWQPVRPAAPRLPARDIRRRVLRASSRSSGRRPHAMPRGHAD